ncbi:Cell division protein FtsH [Methanosarcina sp. Kolksee]|uniref:Cell division protein FtsH n=1 Tax=Methanosarcina vacuolata Z-761 TaxID=1434123 RepID=A0A0E3Q3W7_9EURY|nr:Cell division protein FtsH [Methanosarcina vacuolata Z-761]AKB46826.1 Cell division protein FtsH [Methanosarcina sp. Kolksee]
MIFSQSPDTFTARWGYYLVDSDKKTIKLKVAEADQRDVGKGINRIGDS